MGKNNKIKKKNKGDKINLLSNKMHRFSFTRRTRK
jgi:hypothetical protein